MKKSELRHIIREVIREQRDDLEKNKLRSIKPELPPPPSSTLNSHQQIKQLICDCQPHSHPYCQVLFNSINWPQTHLLTTYSSTLGFTCNGSMCNNQDIGNIFDLPSGPYTITYELLDFYTPQHSLTFRNSLPSTCPPPDPCVIFNNWPLNGTQGCNEFNQQHGATIAGGTPVNSQWSLGGCNTYYPSQNVFCEWCNDISNPVWTTPDTSPIGTSNWLTSADPTMCACC